MHEITSPDQLISLEIDTATKTTFAAVQNHVPILRRIEVHNGSSESLENLNLTLVAQPAFCRSKSWAIDRISASEKCKMSDLAVTLDFGVLDRLNESERGQLTFKLLRSEDVLAEEIIEIELLARDEWGGSSEMAQVLAAFVLPNHAQTSNILKQASRLLEASGYDGSLDGYQSGDTKRTYLLAGAIWSAVSGMGLTYAEPPTSFEARGQKVRDPGKIAEYGLATCLDTSLLLAGALEQTGLNSSVIFTEGHAFTGVWLSKRNFPSTVENDVTEIRKATVAREFIPFETTLVTRRPNVDFNHAVSVARQQLSEEREPEFLWAIDIARARSAGIRPLSSYHDVDQEIEQPQDKTVSVPLPVIPPELEQLPFETTEELPQTADDRVQRWQKKLLDLSLRNRLLNFSQTKQTLSLVCPDVPALEDALADGKRFKIVSLTEENPLGNRDRDAYQKETGSDIYADYVKEAFHRKEVCTIAPEKEMIGRLIVLYRKARSDLAEGGANTLFMSVGFLRWKRRNETRTYRAPLLLMPIKLNRRSAQSSYYLSHHEDEIRFNETLLQLLEQDFELRVPELRGDLPMDESGVDIARVFGVMRNAVRNVPHFEVTEDIAISTFSFAKYLMWKDLVERTDSLRNNRLVRHLIDNPTEPLETLGGDIPKPCHIDYHVSLVDLFTPMPADSSQLSAVVAADKGKDFVVIGPPGTGKSQTIANMMAHCLAKGKTVLFVAEKSAALNVVHRRLKACGLADSCLELHSNKTERKSVLKQLGQAWDRQADDTNQEWLRLTSELSVKRDELNNYVVELHKHGSHGFSIFDAIGFVSGQAADFDLSFPTHDTHDRESYENLEGLAERVGLTYSVISERPALDSVEHTEWSFSWRSDLIRCTDKLIEATRMFADSCRALEETVGLVSDPDMSESRQAMLSSLAKSIEQTAEEDYLIALDEQFEEIALGLDGFEKEVESYLSEKHRLSATYKDDDIPLIPVKEMDLDWRRANAKVWPFSTLGRRRVRKLLQSYADSGKSNPTTELAPILALQKIILDIDNNPLSKLSKFQGAQSDLKNFRAYISLARDLHTSFRDVMRELRTEGETPIALHNLAAKGGESTTIALRAADFQAAESHYSKALATYCNKAGGQLDAQSLTDILSALNELKTEVEHLQDWVKWVRIRKVAEERGLSPLIEALQNGASFDAKSAFRVAYFRWWLPLSLDNSYILRNFSHWEHNGRIHQFRDLVENVQRLASRQVRLKVSHGLPSKEGVARKSELGILRHQLGLQRPRISIRQLLGEMSETFTRLTPCVLMSPLSVAQYLPPDQALFDIVIFDEASQITTWDAIGTIARARQSIIVGDPKQLPPTNFFGRTDDYDEEVALHETDLPSILDEVTVAGLPLQKLNWHYRSRDESLITFSNYHYYSNQLITFPSPRTQSGAVHFHFVKGVYERGKSRTNVIEAREIVRLAVERMNSWLVENETERPTLGVITFNSQQQELILDLLDAERKNNPTLEWFFEDEREEPTIVKNLENIQGDERDVMLFSITFGPDATGKMSMSFGAINNEGGEKRLNVAVTRARAELHVFSSITADKIDTNRAKGLGVMHLKNFLLYAATGSSALAGMDHGSLGDAENPFEISVADGLSHKGWEVRTQIGVSGFRIDLAVVHPDKAGVYIAGIECDGATYHRSATARDRDQIRESILRNLGWEILRIWSTDWFMREQESLNRLDNQLRDLLDRDRRQQIIENEQNKENEQIKESLLDSDETVSLSREGEEMHRPLADDSLHDSDNSSRYGNGELDEQNFDPDVFFEDSYVPTLKGLVSEIVTLYGPLRDSELFRRIARKHGWQRAGRRIRERVLLCLGPNQCHEENGSTFIWKPDSYVSVLPFRSDLRRRIRDIPQAQIFGLIQDNPEVQNSNDMVRDLARLVGLTRLTKDTRKYLEECILAYWELDE